MLVTCRTYYLERSLAVLVSGFCMIEIVVLFRKCSRIHMMHGHLRAAEGRLYLLPKLDIPHRNAACLPSAICCVTCISYWETTASYSGAVPLNHASRDLWKFTPTFCTVCFPMFQFELLKVEGEICFWKLRNEAWATFEYLGWLLAKWLQKIGNVRSGLSLCTQTCT